MSFVNISFVKSILFGSPGDYDVFGSFVQFKDFSKNRLSFFQTPSLEGAGYLSYIANKLLNSNVFRFITLGYCHVFLHEFGHAFTGKLLTGSKSEIIVKTDTCAAFFLLYNEQDNNQAAEWKKTAIDVAGPMFDVTFTTIQIVVANALKGYISKPVALVIGCSSACWIAGELLYAYLSINREVSSSVDVRQRDDFGFIKQRGKAHLVTATTALVAQSALGLYALTKLFE